MGGELSVVMCGICRAESPGHQSWCPVLTQQAILGFRGTMNLENALAELKTQNEVNKRLARELLDVQLDLSKLRQRFADQHRVIEAQHQYVEELEKQLEPTVINEIRDSLSEDK